MAGVAIAMTDHAQLDVGYRFLDLGPSSGISSKRDWDVRDPEGPR
jgi:opacity protein-like surface antigen